MRPASLAIVLSLLGAAAPVRAGVRDAARFRPQAELGAGADARYAERINKTIDKVAAREGVDPRLVHAVIKVESAYQSNARSPKGAMGLMQLMPGTARQYRVANAYEPVANIEAGIKHLKSLLERYPRDLALAAYNAGEAAVERFNGMPPFRETQDYVSRVLHLAGRVGTGMVGIRAGYYRSTLAGGSPANQSVAARRTVLKSRQDPWRAARAPWLQGQPVASSTSWSHR